MKYLTVLTGIVCIFISFACSNGSNPSVPDDPAISESGIMSQKVDTRGVFGAWDVVIDKSTMTAEMLPARNARAIGDIYDADLTQFLEVSPCSNCVTITNVSIDGNDNLNVTFRMRHPFANAAARPDLHGFDVRGIFILSSTVTDSNIGVMMPSTTVEDASYSTLLLNPDGYTSHFDELPTDDRYFIGGTNVTGNLNPFLRYFEDYTMPVFDPAAPQGYNVMPVGSADYDRTAVFGDFGSNLLQFYFVADVAYGQSAVFANRMNPQYYIPAFNRTEPWRAEYWIENNLLDKYDDTSTADVVVQVFDWQQGATVDAAYPDPGNLSGIPNLSAIPAECSRGCNDS